MLSGVFILLEEPSFKYMDQCGQMSKRKAFGKGVIKLFKINNAAGKALPASLVTEQDLTHVPSY